MDKNYIHSVIKLNLNCAVCCSCCSCHLIDGCHGWLAGWLHVHVHSHVSNKITDNHNFINILFLDSIGESLHIVCIRCGITDRASCRGSGQRQREREKVKLDRHIEHEASK